MTIRGMLKAMLFASGGVVITMAAQKQSRGKSKGATADKGSLVQSAGDDGSMLQDKATEAEVHKVVHAESQGLAMTTGQAVTTAVDKAFVEQWMQEHPDKVTHLAKWLKSGGLLQAEKKEDAGAAVGAEASKTALVPKEGVDKKEDVHSIIASLVESEVDEECPFTCAENGCGEVSNPASLRKPCSDYYEKTVEQQVGEAFGTSDLNLQPDGYKCEKDESVPYNDGGKRSADSGTPWDFCKRSTTGCTLKKS